MANSVDNKKFIRVSASIKVSFITSVCFILTGTWYEIVFYPASQEIWSSSVNIVNLIYSLERVQVGAFHRDASADARTNRGAEQNLWSISQSKYCQPGLHNKQRDLRKVSQSFKNIFKQFYKNISRETVASQYFLELAKYVGLPVISWNADNSALEKVKEKVVRKYKD